ADCVTSLGGMPMELDEWKVDIAYAGTQKCLGVAPGLAPFTFSERAWERRVQSPPVWYIDLGLLGAYVRGGPGGRAYHHTAPTSMVASLDSALARIEAEGAEAVAARHEAAGARLRSSEERRGGTQRRAATAAPLA